MNCSSCIYIFSCSFSYICDKTVDRVKFTPHLFFSPIYISNLPTVIWWILFRINTVIKNLFWIRPVFNLLTEVGENKTGRICPSIQETCMKLSNLFLIQFCFKSTASLLYCTSSSNKDMHLYPFTYGKLTIST